MTFKNEQPRTQETTLSLVPSSLRTAKVALKTRIQSEGCYLPLSKCETEHLNGCWHAFLERRGFLYKTLKIPDPRNSNPRFCTAEEAYWDLMNSPDSAFSQNYGKKGLPSFETTILRFTEHCRQKGFFLEPPSCKRSILDKSFKHKDYEHIVFDASKPFDNLGDPPPEPIPEKKEPEKPKPKQVESDSPIYRDTNIVAARHGISKSNFTKKGKSVKMTEVIKWVFDNMPLKDADLESCPSPSAFGLLQWARSEPDKFYTQFVIKLIPSQRELDNAAKLADDGEKALPLLESFIREQD